MSVRITERCRTAGSNAKFDKLRLRSVGILEIESRQPLVRFWQNTRLSFLRRSSCAKPATSLSVIGEPGTSICSSVLIEASMGKSTGINGQRVNTTERRRGKKRIGRSQPGASQSGYLDKI